MTEPRMRHCNRIATRERLTVSMERRSSTGQTIKWLERPVPVVVKP